MVDKIDNDNLVKLINEFIDLDEQENKDEEKIGILENAIYHDCLDNTFVIVAGDTDGEYDSIFNIFIDDEEDDYYIPIFTDIDAAKEALKEVALDTEEYPHHFEAMTGRDVLAIGADDDSFQGVLINPGILDLLLTKDDLIAAANEK